MIQSSVLPAEVHVAPEIEARFEDLLATCHRTLPVVDEAMLRQAFRVAVWAHRDMTRASGEPYVTHPLEVARIYAEEMAMDDVSVAAALLHDVIEDTDVTLAFLRDTFGDTLAHLVDGLTKIGSVAPAREGGQAENVRKLMLSMAQDIRVILVKFADRLHNMRTL
ncbi:MAG TPA: HD domain-containing protein, partial [Rhodothermales bacterium]|nr:HD domain-containing protein [Rhodothermales bacterium]